MFCPECGQTLSRPSDSNVAITSEESKVANEPPQADSNVAIASEEPKVANEPPQADAPAVRVDDNIQAERAEVASPSPGVIQPPGDEEKPEQRAEPAATAGPVSVIVPEHARTAKARETLHRASTAARGAIEGNVKRVEKIRQVSSVVFEEASYDPSLRFVLVALALFVLFAVLLLLSKVMG